MTESDRSERDKAADLAARIAEAQGHRREGPEPLLPMTDRQAMAGGRIGLEFMGAVLAGIGLGWLIDGEFATGPWGTVIGLLAGFVAGFANAWRTISGVTQAVGWRRLPKKKRPKKTG